MKGQSIRMHFQRCNTPVHISSTYLACIRRKDLPCGGCNHCTRAHNQWAQFPEESVSPVVQEGKALLKEVNHREAGARKGETMSAGARQGLTEISGTAEKMKSSKPLMILSRQNEQSGLPSSRPAKRQKAPCKESHLLEAVTVQVNGLRNID